MRGDCRAGGVRVTGYVTPAARYCVITGGAYKIHFWKRYGLPVLRGIRRVDA